MHVQRITVDRNYLQKGHAKMDPSNLVNLGHATQRRDRCKVNPTVLNRQSVSPGHTVLLCHRLVLPTEVLSNPLSLLGSPWCVCVCVYCGHIRPKQGSPHGAARPAEASAGELERSYCAWVCVHTVQTQRELLVSPSLTTTGNQTNIRTSSIPVQGKPMVLLV